MEQFPQIPPNNKSSFIEKAKRAGRAVMAGALLSVATLGSAEAQQGKKVLPQEQVSNQKVKWAVNRAEEVARDVSKVTTAEVARKFESIALRPFVDSLQIYDVDQPKKIIYSQAQYKAIKKEFDKITISFTLLEAKFGIDRTTIWVNLDRMLRYNSSDEGQEQIKKDRQYSDDPKSIDRN